MNLIVEENSTLGIIITRVREAIPTYTSGEPKAY